VSRDAIRGVVEIEVIASPRLGGMALVSAVDDMGVYKSRKMGVKEESTERKEKSMGSKRGKRIQERVG
jgi:hypothetical protein